MVQPPTATAALPNHLGRYAQSWEGVASGWEHTFGGAGTDSEGPHPKWNPTGLCRRIEMRRQGLLPSFLPCHLWARSTGTLAPVVRCSAVQAAGGAAAQPSCCELAPPPDTVSCPAALPCAAAP